MTQVIASPNIRSMSSSLGGGALVKGQKKSRQLFAVRTFNSLNIAFYDRSLPASLKSLSTYSSSTCYVTFRDEPPGLISFPPGLLELSGRD